MHWKIGQPAMGESKVHSTTSRSYLLFPFSTLPLSHCPEYLFLYQLCLSPGVQPWWAFLYFQFPWAFLLQQHIPSGLSSRCLARAGRVPAGTQGYWKLQQLFCSLPWHLGPTGEPEGNWAFSPSFICVERPVLSCVWLGLFRDTLLDVHVSLFLSEEVWHY